MSRCCRSRAGQGGQNAIGPEQDGALGVIRTTELLAADQHYGAKQFFTRAVDTGFSKSAAETMKAWGDLPVEDMVRVIRTFRPDVVINGWGGVHWGHGQHQASGIYTPEAVADAADPTKFPEQIAEGLEAVEGGAGAASRRIWFWSRARRRRPRMRSRCRSTMFRRCGARATSRWAWRATRSTGPRARPHFPAIRFSAGPRR